MYVVPSEKVIVLKKKGIFDRYNIGEVKRPASYELYQIKQKILHIYMEFDVGLNLAPPIEFGDCSRPFFPLFLSTLSQELDDHFTQKAATQAIFIVIYWFVC